MAKRNEQPVSNVKWVDIDNVQANDYNPNSVAKTEMKLLHTSIMHDGYTQPIVTIYDESIKKYVIIDGFHRYLTCKSNKDVQEMTGGKVPIVVIDKDINDICRAPAGALQISKTIIEQEANILYKECQVWFSIC